MRYGPGWNQHTATQWGLKQGLLNPGEAATDGLLMQRAQDAGVSSQVNDAIKQYNSTPTGQGGGVQPIGVEPLHMLEKQGISGLAGALSNYQAVNPQAQQMMEGVQPLVDRGAQAITADGLTGMAQQFMNPYTNQVEQYALDAVQRQGDTLRNRINSSAPGGRSSFGSSSNAIQLSELGRNMMDISGQTSAGIRNNAYNSAFGQAYNTMTGNRDAAMRGAGMLSNAASGAQNVQTSGLSNLGSIAQNLMGAGSYVRNYNQGVSNRVFGEYDRKQNYNVNQLGMANSLLQPFTQTRMGQSQPQMSTLGNLGSAGLTLGGLADQYGF